MIFVVIQKCANRLDVYGETLRGDDEPSKQKRSEQRRITGLIFSRIKIRSLLTNELKPTLDFRVETNSFVAPRTMCVSSIPSVLCESLA